jgi:tryptophan-rich sensory protein
MMGIAFAMIWHSRHPQKNKAMLLFAIQFIFNLAWSFLFFNRHLLGIAFIEILLMGCFIALTIISFYKINKLAAYLLIPYLCWVSFAAVLNGAIWFLNK